MTEYFYPLMGGAMIGTAASLMLLLNGRIAGISTIVNRAVVDRTRDDIEWRWYFVGGLFLGGLGLRFFNSNVFSGHLPTEAWTVALAGALVGFGTVMGNGCTSGHGVCGISRLSIRSIAATMTFIIAGVVAVAIFKELGVYR